LLLEVVVAQNFVTVQLFVSHVQHKVNHEEMLDHNKMMNFLSQ